MIKRLYSHFLLSSGISTDSRSIKTGEIFFAIKGENMDGNLYAEQALRSGASYAVVDKTSEVGMKALSGGASNEKYIPVDDTLKTLQDLASYHRVQFKIPVIALTGTNGKTTTKELINAVLSKKYKTHATVGNFNNHLGVPLTLLKMEYETEIAIIEMGASSKGEIELLSRIVNPTHGLITNIGKAHLLGFGSFEDVITAKGELYDYLNTTGGVVFYNSDNEILNDLVKSRTNMQTIPYGISHDMIEIMPSDPYLEIRIGERQGSMEIVSKLIGEYNTENIAAAHAVGLYFKVRRDDIKDAIEEYSPRNNRSQLTKTQKNDLVVDAYNANPTSMQLSLDNFLKMSGNNKTVILGDMRELGDDSQKEHLKIVEILHDRFNRPDDIILVGDEFTKAATTYNQTVSDFIKTSNIFQNTEQLQYLLQENPLTGRLIFIKGSNGIGLYKIPATL